MAKAMQRDEETGPLVTPNLNDSRIGDFFRDRAVFITGGTGFVGKALVEKLLRSCSELKEIYLLLRPKNGQNVRQRLDDLVTCQVFDRIRRESPSSLNKIIPVSGDITEAELGINANDQKLLMKSISLVFHCAATVRFDEPFRQYVNINVLACRRLLELCKKMEHLEVLVHTSTAYSHCNRKVIDEVVYPEAVPYQKIIDATQWMNDDLLSTISPHLEDGRPCSYHYTKSLAENLLVQECGNIPLAIVRPSIVTAAWQEPIPGWVDNLNGPSGFIVATGKGVLRTMTANRNIGADVVPVDTVVNMLIAVAWNTAIKKPNNIMVYNCTTGSIVKVTWGQIEKLAYPFVVKHPSMQVFRYPGGSFKHYWWLNSICEMVEHNIPAYFVDFLARLTGYKPGLVALYKKLHRAVHILEYFTTNEWTFHCNNVLMLLDQLEGKDKETFSFDVRPIKWAPYMENYVLGVRKFILKEDESTLPAARRKLQRLYYYGQLTRLALILGFIRLLIFRSERARKLWWSLLSYSMTIIQRIPQQLTS
ncbi:putative fatty acyl-CoA reductase CG5065 [Limulus polyphemus]|uniref:Fatty acyl-CoA reductase n=1 Tax=Limulus polyphemus TaxID=6850 RepID=A0ABM1SZC3_LIMPO|nr:putative fatty acyl-CoA reductase CG5065 [Limulus polyphemus]XP_022248979.1 putative fatty acyl-CoA reductase CG5065 [Limulus polyphemus]